MVVWGLGGAGKKELLFNGYGVLVLEYEKVLNVDGSDSCTICTT